ncbi:Uncharacterised protein [Acholeplasma oculi]|uniref:Uncharacterized protein n=1 Tax=Acholeplasma oculi TaxID=35623 RepID=A0A061AB15_9MOLU|nr:hypothetical protein Aocu_05840 [Acholeplasma oculi]CDR31043.1 hypothetical protein Aocu_09700 [Acholeplasma oculi]SKC34610.1 hypothetical protein SAMN02745122_0010 [Acholeplasma oculi]SKC36616.1 hypothetical protein SAMN02745122_0398 [Acholeplasma oculi]SKC36627.1 hypothetical protein SAMN02745122_0401 [Acholeplasma oculi]
MITALVIYLFTLPVRILKGLHKAFHALFIPKAKPKKRGR